MFDFHADTRVYFDYQTANAAKYVIPFIERTFELPVAARVLEIGCGEGGVLRAFMEKGCIGVGVELVASRAENAKEFLLTFIDKGVCQILSKNIYDVQDVAAELGGLFDLIVMKDVIEHIPDQKKLLATLRTFLNKNGCIYAGFPPWAMPFGGHQQICQKSRFLAKLPYYHLLPAFLYAWILRRGGESEAIVKDLLEVKSTGISIERFERISRQNNYSVQDHIHYFTNPIYEYKFGWKPRQQYALIKFIPYFRNLLTSCVYYLIKKEE